MVVVILYVYDVINSISDGVNKVILSLNRIMCGGIGIGGIFYGVVEVSVYIFMLI